MIRKKVNGIFGLALGLAGFLLIMGRMELPAFADTSTTITQAANETTQTAVTYSEDMSKDYFMDINKSETQKGIKVTVEKAISTEMDLKVILKIEGDKPLGEIERNNSIFELTYGTSENFAWTDSKVTKVDDKTKLITLEKDNRRGEFPVKGEMRVDVVLPEYKVNIGMDIPVDFTESFKHIIDKDISTKVSEMDYNFNKLQADVLGTRISYTEDKKDKSYRTEEDYKNEKALWNSVIILKTGDRMYKTQHKGNYSEANGVQAGNYETEKVTYDVLKNEKNVSIVPLVCNIKEGELDKFYNQQNDKVNYKEENLNNVSYQRYFDFSDGSKGEIYNIERTDNTIKVYCKGQSEKESLLMASNMGIYYENSEEKNAGVYYDNDNISFYKDSKKAFGYIVEFDDVQKDTKIKLNIDSLIKLVDKYELSDEIKVN